MASRATAGNPVHLRPTRPSHATKELLARTNAGTFGLEIGRHAHGGAATFHALPDGTQDDRPGAAPTCGPVRSMAQLAAQWMDWFAQGAFRVPNEQKS